MVNSFDEDQMRVVNGHLASLEHDEQVRPPPDPGLVQTLAFMPMMGRRND